MAIDKLVKAAIEAREKAYCPYSKFKVGAAVECSSGKIYGGCNVENSSYGMTICAERVAITKAVSEGEKEIKRLAVATNDKNISFPCGACRQVLLEFGKDAEVYCCGVDGDYNKYTVQDLIPNFDVGDSFRDNLEELRKKN